jgi:hypothetical protein
VLAVLHHNAELGTLLAVLLVDGRTAPSATPAAGKEGNIGTQVELRLRLRWLCERIHRREPAAHCQEHRRDQNAGRDGTQAGAATVALRK